MNGHPIVWQAPQPLWARFGPTAATAATAADQARPAILRFASDDFMEQMLGTLARDPSRLDQLIARPETWRAPAAQQADLVERTPIPRRVQSSLRSMLARRSKGAVPATAHETELKEQAQRVVRPLKLYQPAHQRFYLVAASLVCAHPGLPERAVVPGGAEQVNFVIRRLLPATAGSDPNDLREFAYVKDAQAARWVRAGDGADDAGFVPGEELLPLFTLAYQDDSAGARVLWAGLLPVGRRDEYMGTTVDRSPPAGFAAAQRLSLAAAEPPAPRDSRRARMTQFQLEVAEPWKNLVRSSYKTAESVSTPKPGGLDGDGESDAEKRKRVFEFNLQQQNSSWLILLDFADYLEAYLPDVWAVIENNGAGYPALSAQRRTLYDRLGQSVMSTALRNALKTPVGGIEFRTPQPSLRAALKAIRATGLREKLERTELIYTSDSRSSSDWPPFHFVLAGVNTGNGPDGPFQNFGPPPSTPDPDVVPGLLNPTNTAQQAANALDELTALVTRALEARPEADAPPLPFALQLRDAIAENVSDAGWFVVRFVHQRRDCGPLHLPTLSAPTQRFQLANFFDPDAPARPIRITLPLDTSPAGLRKFNKNTAFVISDMLCGQIQRAKGLGFIDLVLQVLPWPLHKDINLGAGGPCKSGELNIGMICSLSIPIVTLCALILLMIIVGLLDFIFRWLPYLIMCFPIPGFKAKK